MKRRASIWALLVLLCLCPLALVVLLGLRLQTTLLFEAALLVALLGFAGTVALARYLSRGDVIE